MSVVLNFQTSVALKAEAIIVTTGFTLTLLTALYCNYVQLVKTHVASYPYEWFPSVSAVLGDFYPARSIIQISIALAAFPRFLNITTRIISLFQCHEPLRWKNITIFFDLLRTFCIGIFVYVTSNDSAVIHTGATYVYLLSNVIYSCITGNKQGLWVYFGFLATMAYFYHQHQVNRIPGAYSWYGVFEWSIVFSDIFLEQIRNAQNKRKRQNTDTVNYFLSDIWHTVVFWNNVTLLPLMLWHFPLWNMGISGYEVGLVAFLFPMLLPIFDAVRHDTFDIASILSGLSFVGGAFSKTPESRYVLCIIATAASMVKMTARLTQDRNAPRSYLLGLLTFMVSKYANHSISPFWAVEPNGFHGLFLAIHLASWWLRQSHFHNHAIVTSSKSFHFPVHLSFGAGMFLLHRYFTDVESIWLTFNDSTTQMQKYVTIVSLMISFLTLHFRALRVIPFGTIVCITLATRSVVPFLIFSWSLFIFNGKAMGHQLLSLKGTAVWTTFFVLFLLADVWTVAYAFVPGGWLLRECSQHVSLFAMICVIYGDTSSIKRKNAVEDDKRDEKHDFHDCQECEKFHNLTKKNCALFCAGLLFFAGIRCTMDLNLEKNQSKLVRIRDPNVLTVGIWTVHFGLDNDGLLSHRNMTNLIHKLDVDVIGLLESDTMRPIGGNRNILTYMAKKLNMHVVYGPRPSQHTWGCSLLSKYPVEWHETHLLPSPVGELACAIHAGIRMPSGKVVNVITAHNGQEEDLQDRILQTTEIAKMAANKTAEHVVFFGYLVTRPGKGNVIYDIMTEQGNLTDIFPSDKWRWCEYIFYRGLYPLAYGRISHGRVTDTELQSAKFWVGGNTTKLEMFDDPRYGNMYPNDMVLEEWNGHRFMMGPFYDPRNHADNVNRNN